MEPSVQRSGRSDHELLSTVAEKYQIHSHMSKSVDNLCGDDCSVDSRQLDKRQRQLSQPSLSVSDCEEFGEALARAENKGEKDVEKMRQSCKQLRKHDDTRHVGTKKTSLNLPTSSAFGKDIHYDYVRASMVLKLQRIRTLKKNVTQNCKEAVNSEAESDSESGYVIDELENVELDQSESNQRDDHKMPDSGQDQYISLIGTCGEEEKERNSATESTETRSGSPRPPLFLHKHPSLAEFEVVDEFSGGDDYEKIIIYEELGVGEGEEEVEDSHLYDSIHQMRERTTQMVRGKHRKKLKKFIIKRKSSERLPSEVKTPRAESEPCTTPSIVIESESDSSDGDDSVLTSNARVYIGLPLADESKDGRSRTSKKARKGRTQPVLRRSRTYAHHQTQRQSLSKSAVLDKSQYDQMMEMMLNDQEVKQLQNAGAVKIKNLAELRAEIKEMVKNAPPEPPPLPGNSRPRVHDREKAADFKKWSSKSLRY